jgi:hypothetical protein
MNSKYALDYANIGLMILSCIIAFFIPFELFLFSYAVLGPLHYLTEIGWLHQRQYFAKGKYDFVLLVVLSVFITLGSLGMVKAFGDIAIKFIFLAFISGAAMAFIKDNYIKWVIIVLAWMSFFLFKSSNTFIQSFFGIFLPTIIHVFLFTAAFMLFGAMKSRSGPGIASVVVLFLCAAALFSINTDPTYQVSQYVKSAWGGGFDQLNYSLIEIFGMADTSGVRTTDDYANVIFHSNAGFIIARFVAFAYTYHYLNWFSKTNVIKWHKVPKKYLIATVAIWLMAVGIYMYDYFTGLRVLFFLSFLHVLLEFPLNFQSFVGIGREAKNMVTGKQVTVTK